METVPVAEIITRICNTAQPLHPYQKENIAKIITLSKAYSNEAHLPLSQSLFRCDPDVVIESGHQPNFLPYTGIIKKVFLLHWISRLLTDQGFHPVALFGFADENLSTASYLHENIIPSANKSGYEKIGFRIREKNRWKCFNTLEKPPYELWQKEIEKFRRIYQKPQRYEGSDAAEMRARTDQIIELLEGSYKRADNFADLNAYFFSKLCVEVFGLEVFFFRYSDLQRTAVFAEEWKELVSHNAEYVSSYNATITDHALSLHSLAKDHVPFWYHCECGGDVPLIHASDTVKGACPSCGREHVLSLGEGCLKLGALLPTMSLTAVARNLVFAKGLGTRIFVSGAGGGLEYGRISDAVSRALGFPVPATLAWVSRDFYLGQTHCAALTDFMRLFKITSADLIGSTAAGKIQEYRKNLMENIRQNASFSEDKKTLQKYQGQYNNSTIQMEIIKNIFSVTPSMMDVIMNVSPQIMNNAWVTSVEHAPVLGECERWKIHKDTTYDMHNLLNIHENDIPLIYRSIASIEVKEP